MPQLVTDWKSIATEGNTVDGRKISGEDLESMAAEYDPDEYTALIWYEHYRFFGNFGKVVALKTETDKKDRTALFAQIQPNARLLELNKEEQKLFTSIEINPDFASTGKPGLFGLAITDTPASVGTSELRFSRRTHKDGNYFSTPISLDLTSIEEDDDAGIMAKLASLFNRSQETEMKPEQFNELSTAINTLSTQVAELAKFQTLDDTTTDEPEGDDTNDKETVSAEQFNDLNTKLDTLTNQFKALQDNLSQEVDSTLVPETSGDETEGMV